MPPPVEVLGEAHRRAIMDASPGVVFTAEAWAALDETITGFRNFRTRHRRHNHVHERDRWRRILALIETLGGELHATDDLSLAEWSDLLNALLMAWPKANVRVAYFETMVSGFLHRRDPARSFLFWGVMRVWVDQLGGEVGRSTNLAGQAVGPLIQFMQAVLGPVLGDETPTPESLADIIRRERRYGVIKRKK